MTHYSFTDPAVEVELAYRRELLQNLGRGTRTRRNPWLRRRRQSR